jgi:hypothetical protein
MPGDRELDRLIDAVLPAYSEAEPVPGMEQRVIARALVSGPRKQPFVWAWTLAIPAAACISVLFLFVGRDHPAQPTRQPSTQAGQIISTPTLHAIPKQVSSDSARTTPQSHTVLAGIALTPQPLPKQEIFPSPSPLTEEERILIALSRAQVQTPPQPAVAAVDIDPIRIAELQIKPITVSILNSDGPSTIKSIPNDQQP